MIKAVTHRHHQAVVSDPLDGHEWQKVRSHSKQSENFHSKQHCATASGAYSVGYGGTCPPLLQMAGHGGHRE